MGNDAEGLRSLNLPLDGRTGKKVMLGDQLCGSHCYPKGAGGCERELSIFHLTKEAGVTLLFYASHKCENGLPLRLGASPSQWRPQFWRPLLGGVGKAIARK